MNAMIRQKSMVAALLVGAAFSTLSAAPAQGAPDRAIEDVSRYCTRCWRSAGIPAQAWEDCTQQVYCRLLERVPLASWSGLFQLDSAERREFVRAIDAVKKRTQRARRAAVLSEEPADTRESSPGSGDGERDRVLEASTRCLTPRQQDIVQLSLCGYSVHEIAQRLDVAAPRVSDEKYKAIRKLRATIRD
jgi:RNA polymerase sigma factor (sigma-70 family)